MKVSSVRMPDFIAAASAHMGPDSDESRKAQAAEVDEMLALVDSVMKEDKLAAKQDGFKESRDRSTCRHCGLPVRISKEGCWVHDVADEDPNDPDYGWIRCSRSSTVAEPKTYRKTAQRKETP